MGVNRRKRSWRNCYYVLPSSSSSAVKSSRDTVRIREVTGFSDRRVRSAFVNLMGTYDIIILSDELPLQDFLF